MSQYDLIAFDMDGTLLNSEKQISADSLKAIQAAVSQGKLVVLSTGRSLPELKEPLQVLPFVRYVIAVSGGLVYDRVQDRILSAVPLEHNTVTELFRRAHGIDVMIHLLGMKTYTERDKQCRMDEYSMGIYQSLFDYATVKVDQLEPYYLSAPFPVYKFNLYCRSTAQRARLEARLADLPITMVHSEIASLECSAPGVSKAFGLQALLRQLNIPLCRSIAVGDSENDRAMLEVAGLSVAMGNACDSIRALSDVTVKDNDHGGCAEAIYTWLLDR